MGQIAFKLLLAQLNQGKSDDSQGVVLPTKLIIRKSVKTLTAQSKGEVRSAAGEKELEQGI